MCQIDPPVAVARPSAAYFLFSLRLSAESRYDVSPRPMFTRMTSPSVSLGLPLTPGFSPVTTMGSEAKPFQRFATRLDGKRLKPVYGISAFTTRLKPGVNESRNCLIQGKSNQLSALIMDRGFPQRIGTPPSGGSNPHKAPGLTSKGGVPYTLRYSPSRCIPFAPSLTPPPEPVIPRVTSGRLRGIFSPA